MRRVVSAILKIDITTTEGDIHASGAALTAGKTLSLDSAKDILLDAGVSKDHSDGKNSGYGVEVGVGASVGAQTGVYAYVGVQASHGKSLSDSTTYDNTHLTADTINLKANDNITLSGADARANTINADAGENLTIQSLQDQEKSTRKKGTGYFLSRRMANRNCHSNKGFLKHLEIVEDRKRMKMYKKVACPLFLFFFCPLFLFPFSMGMMQKHKFPIKMVKRW